MKRNGATIAYCCLLVGGLFCKVFSEPHAFVKEGYWRATLSAAGRQVPFNLEVRGTSAENAKVFLLTGGQRQEVTRVSQHRDTLLLTLQPYGLLLKARIGKQVLLGNAFPLRSGGMTGTISFRAERGCKHPDANNSLEKITEKALRVGLLTE